MRISDCSSDVCSSDLDASSCAMVLLTSVSSSFSPLRTPMPQGSVNSALSTIWVLKLDLSESCLNFSSINSEPTKPDTLFCTRARYDVGGSLKVTVVLSGLLSVDIGRTSCRERGCQNVKISVLAVILQKHKKKKID